MILTLNAHQLRQALEFAAPGDDEELMDTKVCIGTLPASLYGIKPQIGVWLEEHPEEGCVPLAESLDDRGILPNKEPSRPLNPPQFPIRQAATVYGEELEIARKLEPFSLNDVIEAFIAGALHVVSRKKTRKPEEDV